MIRPLCVSMYLSRLVSVCSSSGRVHVLRVSPNLSRDSHESKVDEIARLELQGDIFSSPVMIGGRIFVGCRDDYVHCLSLESCVFASERDDNCLKKLI